MVRSASKGKAGIWHGYAWSMVEGYIESKKLKHFIFQFLLNLSFFKFKDNVCLTFKIWCVSLQDVVAHCEQKVAINFPVIADPTGEVAIKCTPRPLPTACAA